MRKLIIICLLFLLAIPMLAQDELTPSEIALQRIVEARASWATTLDLSGLGLTELPPEIGQLTNIQYLYLSDNQLDNLPPEIGRLTNLQGLYVSGNQLRDLPPEIGQLTHLYELTLNHNQLTTLPSEIGRLTNLRGVLLNNNRLRQLPPEMSNLTGLTCIGCFLELDNNPLISPPSEVVEQGTEAVLEYLRNQAWHHTRNLILMVATGIGLLVALILGFRLKQRGQRKSKQKREML